MEEELNEWVIPKNEYRNLYYSWMERHSTTPIHSCSNESVMWEMFEIYTDDNLLKHDSFGNVVFKIKDSKKFSMARIKYDF